MLTELTHELNENVDIYFDDFSISSFGKKATIIQEDSYYPFGLTFNEYKREGALDNKFRYNGKERDTELGLNWDAFGARMYDSELARFHTLDPKAEIYNDWSPYLYAANDPIRYVDKNGEGPGDAIIGFLVAVTDNYTGVNLRDSYKPSGTQAAKDYNNGQNVGDIGTFLIGTDVASTSGGVAVVSTAAGQLEVAVPAAAVGVWNGVAASRGLVNFANQNGRVNADGKSKGSNDASSSVNDNSSGKQKNKLTPDEKATGDHTSFARDNNGDIYKYQENKQVQNPSGQTFWDKGKRFDGGKPDGSPGAPHNGKPTPHINEKDGSTRPPTPAETPNNKRFKQQ